MTPEIADRVQALAAHYGAMWAEAAPAVRGGGVVVDPWVDRPAADRRRGVTLLVRPNPPVAAALAGVLAPLRRLEPAQYYQPAGDIHLTVLSLFTAVPDYASFLARLPAYHAAISEVVAETPPFAVEVRGLTLSPGAVLAQGFPCDDTLAVLRERLRAALVARGVGDTLDRRYRLVTAHLTLVRFGAPLSQPACFVEALAALRDAPLGTFDVQRLELVLGDWYHRAAHDQPLAEYTLGGRRSTQDDRA